MKIAPRTAVILLLRSSGEVVQNSKRITAVLGAIFIVLSLLLGRFLYSGLSFGCFTLIRRGPQAIFGIFASEVQLSAFGSVVRGLTIYRPDTNRILRKPAFKLYPAILFNGSHC